MAFDLDVGSPVNVQQDVGSVWIWCLCDGDGECEYRLVPR